MPPSRSRRFSSSSRAMVLYCSGSRKRNDEVFHLPLDLPDAEAGWRAARTPASDSRASATGHRPSWWLPNGAASAAARPGRSKHHAQVAREREQHLAHPLGLRAGDHPPHAEMRGGRTSLLLHCTSLVYSPATFRSFAEHLGDHFHRACSSAGTNRSQVAGRPHRVFSAHGRDDGSDRVGMRERVLARVELFVGDQRLGERAHAPACSPSPACGRPLRRTAGSRPPAIPTAPARADWIARASQGAPPGKQGRTKGPRASTGTREAGAVM